MGQRCRSRKNLAIVSIVWGSVDHEQYGCALAGVFMGGGKAAQKNFVIY